MVAPFFYTLRIKVGLPVGTNSRMNRIFDLYFRSISQYRSFNISDFTVPFPLVPTIYRQWFFIAIDAIHNQDTHDEYRPVH